MSRTGWPPGMLQDDSPELSRWLSRRPDARRLVRESAQRIEDDPMSNDNKLREALEQISRYKACNGDTWPADIAKAALAATSEKAERGAQGVANLDCAAIRTSTEDGKFRIICGFPNERAMHAAFDELMVVLAAPPTQPAQADEVMALVYDYAHAYHLSCTDEFAPNADESLLRAALNAAPPTQPAQADEVKPEHGTSEDLGEAAALVAKITAAKTNGEALGEVLAYRKRVRAALTQRPAAPLATDAGVTLGFARVAAFLSKYTRCPGLHPESVMTLTDGDGSSLTLRVDDLAHILAAHPAAVEVPAQRDEQGVAVEKTRSQKLHDAGFTRRPTWRSLPKEDDADCFKCGDEFGGVTFSDMDDASRPEPYTLGAPWNDFDTLAEMAYLLRLVPRDQVVPVQILDVMKRQMIAALESAGFAPRAPEGGRTDTGADA